MLGALLLAMRTHMFATTTGDSHREVEIHHELTFIVPIALNESAGISGDPQADRGFRLRRLEG